MPARFNSWTWPSFLVFTACPVVYYQGFSVGHTGFYSETSYIGLGQSPEEAVHFYFGLADADTAAQAVMSLRGGRFLLGLYLAHAA